eukprot:m.361227 g.361227  ORF g.361227 m.361227 type:complete len:431 (+) comp19430_c0_seq1:93-1385(+)
MGEGQANSGCGGAVLGFFEYDTLKTVHITNHKVGLLYRLLQLFIIGYIVGYAILWDKGYQKTDSAVSSIFSKVKGVGITCNDLSLKYWELEECANRSAIQVWDVADYVVPSQESNAFFIITNSLETKNQTQRPQGWAEDPLARTSGSDRTYICESDADCTPHRFSASRNGAVSGTCNTDIKRCDVYGWGPVELSKDDDLTQELGYARQMPMVENFTVFIKNNILFPEFKEKFGNTGLGNNSAEYLKSCLWDPEDNKFCPVFRIGSILNEAGFTNFTDDGMKAGAVVTIGIHYDCNLDQNTTVCEPEYTFTRIDTKSDPLSKGYNFRFAKYSVEQNPTRDLYKVYGLRFIFVISGTAGKFDFVPLLVTFGSGLGLLGLATLCADLIVTNCLKKHRFYFGKKYEIITKEEEETFVVIDEDTPLINPTQQHLD